jgi:hypothetical protein
MERPSNEGAFSQSALESLAELMNGFGGELIFSEDERFDRARRVWNLLIDRKPHLIAQCRGMHEGGQKKMI